MADIAPYLAGLGGRWGSVDVCEYIPFVQLQRYHMSANSTGSDLDSPSALLEAIAAGDHSTTLRQKDAQPVAPHARPACRGPAEVCSRATPAALKRRSTAPQSVKVQR